MGILATDSKGKQADQRRLEASDLLTYIDVASPLLNEKGEPLQHIPRDNMLHLNKDGYATWTAVVRKVLMDNEGQHVAK